MFYGWIFCLEHGWISPPQSKQHFGLLLTLCWFLLPFNRNSAGEDRCADDDDSGRPHAHRSRQTPENHRGSSQSAGLNIPLCPAPLELFLDFKTFYSSCFCKYLYRMVGFHWFSWHFHPFSLQQARELVVKLIRDKDQGDFRTGRAEFGSKMGGTSLDVRHLSACFLLMCKPLKCKIFNCPVCPCYQGCSTKICSWHNHWQERRDDQKNSKWCWRQDPVQTR